MGERKVLNKYFPPDFDPSKIPNRTKPKNQQIKVRSMLPFTSRCNTCGNYLYKGTKFNSRKEDVLAETYLGIEKYRLYSKCTHCSAEFAIKTDPRNSDYEVETGATRNLEPWRVRDEEIEKEKKKREAEEIGDAMKALENKASDSKWEMDSMAALYEMKSIKSRHARVTADAMLQALQGTGEDEEIKLDEEDEALIQSIFHGPKQFVRRIDDEEWDDGSDEIANDSVKKRKLSEDASKSTDVLTKSNITEDSSNKEPSDVKPFASQSPAVRFMLKRKPVQEPDDIEPVKEETKQKGNSVSSVGLQSLRQYDSEDE